MTTIDSTPAETPAKPTPPTGHPRRKPKVQSASSAAASPDPAKPASKQTLPISKSATVIKLLSRTKGATVEELMAETSWQPHSVRAYFSGLRKKGHVLVRELRKGGDHAYRIGAAATDSASAVQIAGNAAEPAPTDAPANGAP